ncbi:MAG: hypothetical protein VKI93_02180 [Synechococcus sp.]|nr:hypothetical protein [Synechococcus sp.]
MHDTGLHLVAATGTHNGGFTVDVEVEFTFEDQIGLIPGVGVRRLADITRGRELSDAVFAVGLLGREAQGDRITEDVSDLWLLLAQTEHGRTKNNCTFADLDPQLRY